MRVTLSDYLGKWAHMPEVTETVRSNALDLLARVEGLLADLVDRGADLDTNPKTGTLISGSVYGGFRPVFCPEGASRSSHKTGQGVDIYDPDGDLDDLCDDGLLAKHGLFREHPSATRSWIHLTTRSPKSGNRSFFP